MSQIKRKHKGYSILVLSLLIAFMPSISNADDAMANQYLQRAMNELEAAKLYIQDAEHQEAHNERVVFHYDWLVFDVNKIEGGIQQKFNKPRIEPRVISPITGDYISVVGENNK